jgi:hypothetical protein
MIPNLNLETFEIMDSKDRDFLDFTSILTLFVAIFNCIYL